MRQLQNSRFGTIEYDPSQVVEFERGLVGFANQTKYILIQHKPDSPVHWLQSVEVPELAFPLVNPDRVVQGYTVAPPPHLSDFVGPFEPPDLWMGVIVSFPGGSARPSLNLKAPVIINSATRRAVQLVLEEDLPVRLEIGSGYERGQ